MGRVPHPNYVDPECYVATVCHHVRFIKSLNISKQHLAPMSEDYMHIIYDQKQDRF